MFWGLRRNSAEAQRPSNSFSS